MSKHISLTKDQFATVDDADYDWLSQWSWYFLNIGYAARKPWKSGQILMHRVIMNAPAGMQVDHINQDKLDNRRCNLRLATSGENKRNRPKTKHFSRSQYKGVSLDPRSGRYYAHITVDRKNISLGGYSDEIDAAKAYDVAALEYHGEFAYLNFPINIAEAAALPTCINHPGRETVGTIDTNGICYECVETELMRHRLWLRSFGVVRGGVEALRP